MLLWAIVPLITHAQRCCGPSSLLPLILAVWAVTQGAVFIVPVRSHPSSSLSLGHCPGSCLSVGHWTRRRSVGGTLPKKTFLCGPLRCCCGLSSLSLLVLGIVVGRHPSRHLLSFYCSLFPFFCHDSIHASPTTRRIHPTTAPPPPSLSALFPLLHHLGLSGSIPTKSFAAQILCQHRTVVPTVCAEGEYLSLQVFRSAAPFSLSLVLHCHSFLLFPFDPTDSFLTSGFLRLPLTPLSDPIRSNPTQPDSFSFSHIRKTLYLLFSAFQCFFVLFCKKVKKK
jgi:hypothetical protein